MNVQNIMLPQFSEQIMTTTDSVRDTFDNTSIIMIANNICTDHRLKSPKSKTTITWSTLDSSSFNVKFTYMYS